jgi:hypothetical protein
MCAKAISPSDSVDLTNNNGENKDQFVFVGTGGNVKVTPAGNDDAEPVTFIIPTGGFVPCRVRRVWSSVTTAVNMIGLF